MVKCTALRGAPLRPSRSDFEFWQYSRNQHFEYFKSHEYDLQLFGSPVDPCACNLKVYQDLLTYGFIQENFRHTIKMLDIGGGESRILNHFKKTHECWNIDKLEGVGNGPKEIETNSINLVRDYMGNFSKELPDNYFDFVFSISVFEHVEQDNRQLHANITQDILRVLKPGGIVLHSLDCVKKEPLTWANPILMHFYEFANPICDFKSLDETESDQDLYTMSKVFYDQSWASTTGKSYEEFGAPFSYNFCSVNKQ